jgi:hypothetical protein
MMTYAHNVVASLVCILPLVAAVRIDSDMMLGSEKFYNARFENTLRTKESKSASFLCFIVVKPGSYEIDLLEYTYTKQKGIFECDEHLVVSNSTILEPLNAVTAGKGDVNYALIDGDLEANLVNGWANNTAVVRKVWHSVAEHPLFEGQTWIVKLDIDTVISASRLRRLLSSVPVEMIQSSSGVFIQNYPRSHLQGPVEILSKPAVVTLVKANGNCYTNLTYEDWWLQECMLKLGVAEVNGLHRGSLDGPLWNLIRGHSAHISNAAEDTCGKLNFAAFHPFKNVTSYNECAEALAAKVMSEKDD